MRGIINSGNTCRTAYVLRHYRIRPTHIRIGKEVHRGYTGADFRDAMLRYVSAADARTRIEGIKRKWQLQDEARAQSEKELELRKQLMATVQKEKKFSPESWAMLDELNNMEKINDAVPSLPARDKEENNALTP